MISHTFEIKNYIILLVVIMGKDTSIHAVVCDLFTALQC